MKLSFWVHVYDVSLDLFLLQCYKTYKTLKWSGLCVAAALQNHMRAMHAQHTPCLVGI